MAVKNIWTKRALARHKIVMWGSSLIATALFVGSPADAGTIRQVAATDNSVTVQFDDVVTKASIFSLARPDRIAVDISGATAARLASSAGPLPMYYSGSSIPTPRGSCST